MKKTKEMKKKITRAERMYELGVGENSEHSIFFPPKRRWHEKVRIKFFNWLACGILELK